MVDPLAARTNQLRHIEAKTGQRFAQLCALITTSGLAEVGEQLMAAIAALGAFEIAPKKSDVCLRRKKQFAMLRPATKDQLELGLNHRALPPSPRLKTQPPASMCQYTVQLGHPAEIDAEWPECAVHLRLRAEGLCAGRLLRTFNLGGKLARAAVGLAGALARGVRWSCFPAAARGGVPRSLALMPISRPFAVMRDGAAAYCITFDSASIENGHLPIGNS